MEVLFMNKRNEIMNFEKGNIVAIDFIQSWLDEQNSQDTIKKYKSNVQEFFKKVRNIDSLEYVTANDLSSIDVLIANKYISYLKKKHTDVDGLIMKTTINNKISSLSSLYRYLIKKTGKYLGIKENPFAEQFMKGSKNSVKHSEPFSKEEINSILKELDRRLFNSKNLKNYRNKTLVLNYLTTGARQKELLQIKYKDINFHNQSFNVLGKGNKIDELKPSKVAWQSLIDYLEFIGYDNVNSNDYVFIRNVGDKKHLETSTWRDFLSRFLKRLGIQGKSTHSFRSTYCIDLIEAGLPIHVVKFKMRHGNIATTNDYLAYVNKKQSEMDAVSIMNNLYG